MAKKLRSCLVDLPGFQLSLSVHSSSSQLSGRKQSASRKLTLQMLTTTCQGRGVLPEADPGTTPAGKRSDAKEEQIGSPLLAISRRGILNVMHLLKTSYYINELDLQLAHCFPKLSAGQRLHLTSLPLPTRDTLGPGRWWADSRTHIPGDAFLFIFYSHQSQAGE